MGCGNANNFLVGLFEDGTSYTNETISISARESRNVSLNWTTKIGNTDIFIYTDLENIIPEENETDNSQNITLSLTSWQEIYGNREGDFFDR